MIRDAIGSDVDALVEMGARFARAEFDKKIVVDAPTLRVTLTAMIDGEAMLLLVDEHDGIVRGAVGAMTYTHPFSGETVAVETFWWVDPGRRGGGLRLFKSAEEWARKRGAVKMVMGAPAGRDMTAFYGRLGYEELERSYQGKL